MKKKINRRDWLDLWKVINKKCVDEPRRVNSGLSHDCCVIFEKSIGRRLEEVVVVVHSSPRLGKRLLLFTSSCLAIQQHVYFFPSRSSLWCLPPTSSLLSILPPPLSLFPLFLSFFFPSFFLLPFHFIMHFAAPYRLIIDALPLNGRVVLYFCWPCSPTTPTPLRNTTNANQFLTIEKLLEKQFFRRFI